jgi:hypothetical protein
MKEGRPFADVKSTQTESDSFTSDGILDAFRSSGGGCVRTGLEDSSPEPLD